MPDEVFDERLAHGLEPGRHADRAYSRASAELAKRRKERQLAERGFASQKRAETAEEQRAAEEKRREEIHSHKIEHHKTVVAIGQKKLEFHQLKNMMLVANDLKDVPGAQEALLSQLAA